MRKEDRVVSQLNFTSNSSVVVWAGGCGRVITTQYIRNAFSLLPDFLNESQSFYLLFQQIRDEIMDRKRHLVVDRAVFGQEFNPVHKWLDAMFPKYVKSNPFLHWKERHHLKAVEEKYEEYSVEAAAARLHIVCDFLSHFRLPLFTIPKDEHEVLELLQNLGLCNP